MNNNLILIFLLSCAIHTAVLVPMLSYTPVMAQSANEDSPGIEIKIHCDECEYDPEEHDEPHEKMIDIIFCQVKKVVKAGAALFIIVASVVKFISVYFKK